MAQAPPRILVNPVYCTTLNAIPGFKIVQQFGIARGLTVRTPNVGKQVFAGFASLGGGESTVFMDMAEKARETALQRMLEHAGAIGANAIIGMRYDTQEIVQGMTEVLAYGTAVAIVPIN